MMTRKKKNLISYVVFALVCVAIIIAGICYKNYSNEQKIKKADSVSAIFHAGDYTGDAEDLESIYPNIPIYYVKGNNDYFSKAPSHMLVTIDGVKIFITHGHEQNVKYEYEFMTLRKAAEKYDPDLIIFGHTHIPYTDYKGKATLLNPGSIRYTGTYAEAEIENGKLKTKIIEV